MKKIIFVLSALFLSCNPFEGLPEPLQGYYKRHQKEASSFELISVTRIIVREGSYYKDIPIYDSDYHKYQGAFKILLDTAVGRRILRNNPVAQIIQVEYKSKNYLGRMELQQDFCVVDNDNHMYGRYVSEEVAGKEVYYKIIKSDYRKLRDSIAEFRSKFNIYGKPENP
ncbi:hypothetical protein GTQ34_16360 [Muricauda sp. JGD-17]|uniref:Lipoprotein n=1 Tax=Flagellimonas ochracea TaxID=2696472 RepID=A0A964TFI2_9FLAO|nr:hypothetical protein [Allomuricauda ochracea]NAY93486.1 hypothetical protein [Allomuricauda ochracea]